MTARHKHIAELQSIRGIAALVVLLHHCSFFFVMPAQYQVAAETVFNAHAAVVSFFVLSGYVLTMPLMRGSIDSEVSIAFLVRRVFRIYPAIWGACLLSILLLFAVDNELAVPNRSDWALQWFRLADRDLKHFATSFLGYGVYLVPPLWSVTVELFGSVLVLCMAVATRRRPVAMVIFIIVLAGISLALPTERRAAVTFAYLVHFAFGASIPLWAGRLGPHLGARSSRWLAVLCLVVMAAFRLIGGWDFMHFYNAPLPGLVEGAMAAVLIAIIVTHREAFPLLSARPFVQLGDISYSLYLIHFPIMVAIATVGAGLLKLFIFGSWPLSSFLLIALTLLMSTGLAHLSYRWIELPGIKAGNWLLSILILRTLLPAIGRRFTHARK